MKDLDEFEIMYDTDFDSHVIFKDRHSTEWHGKISLKQLKKIIKIADDLRKELDNGN